MPESDPRPAVNPNALSLADAARILSTAGGRLVTERMLREDVEAGAPVNPDGTLNLVYYTAWQVKELANGG